YSFYDPSLEKRSLGTWSILWLVEECGRQGLPYVYLGYWIGEGPEKGYKARLPAGGRPSGSGWGRLLRCHRGPRAAGACAPFRREAISRCRERCLNEIASSRKALPGDNEGGTMTIGLLQSVLFADTFGTEKMRDAFGDLAFIRNCVIVEA